MGIIKMRIPVLIYSICAMVVGLYVLIGVEIGPMLLVPSIFIFATGGLIHMLLTK